jgi:hypothetical protein
MAINQFSHNSNEPLQVKDLNVSGSETIGNLSAGVGSITSLSGTAVTYTTGSFGRVSASNGLTVGVGGKIGIGTAVPSKTLDVQGDIKLTGGIYDNIGLAGTAGQVLASTGTGITWSNGNSINIQDTQLINENVYPTFADIITGIQTAAKVSSGYFVYNPFLGRVGIGTTLPESTFQVGAGFTVNSTGTVRAKEYFGDGSNLSGLVPNTVATSSTTTPQFIGFSSVSTGINTAILASSTLVFVPSGIGSLGIGTTSPTNTLHVQGDARITGGIYAGAGNTTGTSGQFLQSTGSSFQWVNSSASVGVATTTSTATQFLTFVTGVGATSTLGIGTAGSLSFSPSNRTLSISSISIGQLIRDAAGTWQPTDGFALKYIAANNRVEWGPVVSSVPVSGAAGVSGQVQYNNAGGFAGASFFNYDITTGNVGIGTSTSITSKLTVQGDVKVSGVVTATTFYGSGANLTGINTGSASGSSGQVQFNNAGVFSGASYFNYNPSTFSVGIGTSAPTGRLSVASTSSGNSLLLVNDNTNDGSLFRVSDNSGLILFDVDAGGTIIMPITGNVGIGSTITTPTSKLQVAGGGSFSGDMFVGGNAVITGILTARVAGTVTGAAGTSGQVQVNIGGSFAGAPYLNYDATNIRVGIGTSVPSGRLSIANTSTGNSLLLVNDNLSDGTLFRVNDNSGTPLFDVDAGGAVIFNTYGNVGIGTTLSSASSKLQVVGDVLVSGVVTATTFNGQVNSGISTITTLIGTAASVTNVNSGIITARTELDVGVGGTFGAITSTGLGIGTGNPTAKLQVVGAANTSLLLVNENLSDGSLFRVADGNSNILFDVDANGLIIAPYATTFGLGTFTPTFPFQVGSGSTGFVVSGLGSVGIGTNNPLYPLTVASSSATATPSLSNVIADFTTNTNSYSQINTRNASSGTNASTDIIATANSGSDTTNYIDLGINNSGYSVAGWTINGPLDGYLYTSDTNLSIGAAGVNKYVSLFAGGTLAANEILRANSTGVGIGTTNPTSALTVTGSGTTTSQLTVSGVSTFAGIATHTAPLFGTQATFIGVVTARPAATQDAIAISGRAGGTGSFAVTLRPTTLTASRTATLPDADTTIPVATQALTFSGPTAARTYTLPDANSTIVGTVTDQALTTKIITLKGGTATASTAPLKFTSGTNLGTAEAGAVEYDGTVATLTPNTSLGRAVIATPVFTSGASPSTTVTGSTNIPLFPAANDTITLPIGTYLVETAFQVTVATSTVSATVGLNISGGGNAVGTVSWTALSSITAGGASNLFRVASGNITANATVTAASAVAGRVYIVNAKGIMKITTAGTIIPSLQWSATLTSGVLTWEPSNFMTITPLATSSTTAFTGAFS